MWRTVKQSRASFPLLLMRHKHLIQERFCNEKLEVSHSQGPKGFIKHAVYLLENIFPQGSR